MSDHPTPGLLTVEPTSSAYADIDGVYGQTIANAGKANARRLVACWNALEGVSTADIEAFTAYMSDVRAHIGKVGQLHTAREAEYAAARALLAEIQKHAHPSTRQPHVGVTLDDRINAFLKGGAA